MHWLNKTDMLVEELLAVQLSLCGNLFNLFNEVNLLVEATYLHRPGKGINKQWCKLFF